MPLQRELLETTFVQHEQDKSIKYDLKVFPLDYLVGYCCVLPCFVYGNKEYTKGKPALAV